MINRADAERTFDPNEQKMNKIGVRLSRRVEVALILPESALTNFMGQTETLPSNCCSPRHLASPAAQVSLVSTKWTHMGVGERSNLKKNSYAHTQDHGDA